MALDHSCLSDYVWQLELRRETAQVSANFREVRLPRSVAVNYPRNPLSLADEWTAPRCGAGGSAARKPLWDIFVPHRRTRCLDRLGDRHGGCTGARDARAPASALLTAGPGWALERGVQTSGPGDAVQKINLAFALHRNSDMNSAGIMTNITQLKMWRCSLGEH